jgi:restriction system protein
VAVWLVRSGRHGEGEMLALTASVVGIGWADAGDLSAVTSLKDIRRRLVERWPDAKPSTVANWAGQIDAFRNRIQHGDVVALPLKTSPAVAFGRVTGSYRYVPDAPESMRHQRSVERIREDVPRDQIDQDLRYSLGAFLTVCQIRRNNAEARILALLSHGDGPTTTKPAGPASVDDVAIPVDLGELSRDQIRQRLADRFHGHDLARLIGELLRAEGFIADVSPAGPDGGVDILAGEGGMGFDGVRLAVQVKSGGTAVDAPTLRELQGVMANFGATRGLLVGWAGFTKSARAEARRLFFQIRLWDSDAVIAKVTDVYDKLSPETQTELPLRKIWTLVPDDPE